MGASFDRCKWGSHANDTSKMGFHNVPWCKALTVSPLFTGDGFNQPLVSLSVPGLFNNPICVQTRVTVLVKLPSII